MKALAFSLLAACAVDPTYSAHITNGDPNTRCTTVELDNPSAVAIGSLRATFDGIGHVVIYRARPDLATTWPCSPMDGGDPLIVAQSTAELAFPAETGLFFEAHQPLIVETSGTGTVELEATPAADGAREVTITQLQIPAPDIGANSIQVISAAVPDPAPGDSYLAFVGHTHEHGVGVNIALADDVFGDKQPLYIPSAYVWDAPHATAITPIVVPPEKTFFLQCTFTNTGVTPVTGEMCGAWAFHVPAR